MVTQIGAKAGGDRFGDFNGRKLDTALPKCVAYQWRYGDGLRGSAIEKALDLAVSDHPVEQAGPAGGFAWHERRPDQRKHARWLHEQPWRLARNALLVEFGELTLEIVIDQRDGQIRRSRHNVNAEFAQSRRELLGAGHVDRFHAHLAAAEIFLGYVGRQPKA